MPKRMLIDASHPEETRVVVLDGQKVEEFDFEAASKRPLKGNIYLAKVTRVEPSLQAAFVEYGGNRQGFLAFSEIHPDYYQIPVADRMALLAEQEAEARRRLDDEFESFETAKPGRSSARTTDEGAADELAEEDATEEDAADDEDEAGEDVASADENALDASVPAESADNGAEMAGETSMRADDVRESDHDTSFADAPATGAESSDQTAAADAMSVSGDAPLPEAVEETDSPAPMTGERENDEAPRQALNHRPAQRWVRRRHYKIQEVIKRRQIILVQVVKEERGNKGAALTTYLSLAGRYCVLMPNTPRGGGISRKITNANDRKRLKSAAQSLELPEGMGLIIRTAGENRTKIEIKRDYEYLLRMWDTIREITLKSNAPSCVYEEGDLIKRAIRDLYNKDVSEVIVEGEDGYRNAKDFMRMLMPSHAKNVKQYKEAIPLFQRMHIEAQLDAMFSPTVTLRSGGYVVINQTEALVAIDVNSGRATREHSIEDTAYKTNLEAAEEIARQLRLRDLAGLIVIDFIDMEDARNDRNVEKRLRDCVKNDRARVQIGKISQFGLLEMSRQRLRAGVVAGSTIPCPACGGQGIVRSVESTALRVLRAIDEEGQRQRVNAIVMHVPADVATYTLNQKRRELARMEQDYGIGITLQPKSDILAGTFEMERIGQRVQEERERPPAAEEISPGPVEIPAESDEPESAQDQSASPGPNGEQQGDNRRRRRRRRRGRDRGPQDTQAASAAPSANGSELEFGESEDDDGERDDAEPADGPAQDASAPAAGPGEGGGRRRRRRRRRGRRGPREGAPFETRSEDGAASFSADGLIAPSHAEESALAAPPSEDLPVASRAAEPPAALNAPSTPVWTIYSTEAEEVSATVQTPAVTPDNSMSESPMPLAARPDDTLGTQDNSGPPSEQLPHGESRPLEVPPPAPSEPARKGWWQRPFRARE